LCATKQTERKKKKLVHKRTHTPAASLSWSFNSVSQWHLALANTHTHTGFFGLHSRPVVWLSIQAFYMIMSNNFIPPTTPQMPSLKQKVKTGKENKKNENDDLFFSFLPGWPAFIFLIDKLDLITLRFFADVKCETIFRDFFFFFTFVLFYFFPGRFILFSNFPSQRKNKRESFFFFVFSPAGVH
jgi:hypothetical protein